MWMLVVAVAAAVLLDLTVLRFGADTRDGRDWQRDVDPRLR